MHLAYLDETGTDGYSPIVMYGALIVPVGKFGYLSGLHSAAIQQIIPIDRIIRVQVSCLTAFPTSKTLGKTQL